MGATSSQKAGGMLIDFTKDHYYPGDEVNGNVYINIVHDIESYGIEIDLQILEGVNFNKRDSAISSNLTPEEKIIIAQQEMQNESKAAKVILYQNTWIIAKFSSNVLTKGQYIYPFTFTLPSDLPGSFEYYDETSSAFIKYLIHGRLVSSNGRESEMNAANLIFVRQSLDNFECPDKKLSTKNIKSWCCISQGPSTLNISLLKDHSHPDEELKVTVSLDNSQCQLDAKNIKLEVFQSIELKDRANNTKLLNRKISEHNYKGNYVKYFLI